MVIHNQADLDAIVGEGGGNWTSSARHIFGTVFGSEDEFDRFSQLCEELYVAGDLTTVVIGRELAPDTGRPHLHITASHAGKKAFNWWRTRLNDSGLVIGGNRNDVEDADGSFGVWFRVRRGTFQQAREYTLKGGDVVMDVSNETNQQGRRSDIDRFVDAVKDGTVRNLRDAIDHHASIVARFGRFVQLCFSQYTEVDYTRGAPLPANLRLWQIDMLEICLRDPERPADMRTINIVRGTSGNEGKSFMSRFLQRIIRENFDRPRFKVQVIRPNKADNMAYVLKEDNDVIIFDVARSKSAYFQYHLCEEIKDGIVSSYKYEPREMLLAPVHLFIFCNDFTNEDEKGQLIFSEDRLRWIDISENDLRARRFEEAKEILERRDPNVPNFGPEFNGDNAGDGPVMNNAAYRMMHPRDLTEFVDGIPVLEHEEREVPVALEQVSPIGRSSRLELKGWPSAADKRLWNADKRWCMLVGDWVPFLPGSTYKVHFNPGPYEGKAGTWYWSKADGDEVPVTYPCIEQPIGVVKLPATCNPYYKKVTYVNRVTYSLHFGWARGRVPPKHELTPEEHLVPVNERGQTLHPCDFDSYDDFERYLLYKQEMSKAKEQFNDKHYSVMKDIVKRTDGMSFKN